MPQLDTDSSVAVLFERIAQASPDALALVSRTTTRTYGELNREANRIAHGVDRAVAGGNGALATLMVDAATQVAAMLAAYKLGRRYVPIDAGCPNASAERNARNNAIDAGGANVRIMRFHPAAGEPRRCSSLWIYRK